MDLHAFQHKTPDVKYIDYPHTEYDLFDSRSARLLALLINFN